MKKIFILISGLIICVLADAGDGFSIGFKIQPQMSAVWGRNDILNSETLYRKPDNIIGFNLYADYSLPGKSSIGIGISYSPYSLKEEKLEQKNHDRYFYFSSQVKYIRFPLLVQYQLRKTDAYQISIVPAIGFNYILKANDNLSNVLAILNTVIKDPSDRYNKVLFDFGASVELKYLLSGKFYLTVNIGGKTTLNRFHIPYDLGTNAKIDIKSKFYSYGLSIGINRAI